MKEFTSASIKSDVYKKLSKKSKQEKHTISDQLEIILSFYDQKKRSNEK